MPARAFASSVDPALPPRTVAEHVEDAVHPARAGLAMGLAALGLIEDAPAVADELAAVEGPAAGRRALEALRRGAHVRLTGPPGEDPHLDDALAAGLDHRRAAPDVRTMVAAAEAGRPALVLVDRAALHDAPAGAHWVLVVQQADDEAVLHDPLLEEGPTREAWATLGEAAGYQGRRRMLELAKAPREHRV